MVKNIKVVVTKQPNEYTNYQLNGYHITDPGIFLDIHNFDEYLLLKLLNDHSSFSFTFRNFNQKKNFDPFRKFILSTLSFDQIGVLLP